jgi:hypothetical protein
MIANEHHRQRDRWEKRQRKEAEQKRERMSEAERELLERTGCDGKIRHASGHDANVQASRLYQKRGYRLTAYACAACGAWHLGRDSRKPKADEPVPEIPITGEEN